MIAVRDQSAAGGEVPVVSVLMTTYNGLAYLKEAIDSVLAQSFTAFEFIIIDDASTDETLAVVQSYTDPRLRIFRNPQNLGQTRTLGLGLTVARGRLIARLDQDDVCLTDRLRDQVAFHDAHPDVAVSSTWEHTIDSTGRVTRLWTSKIDNFGAFLGTLAVGKCPIWHPSVMFVAQEVRNVGGYDPEYQLAEDFDLWLKLAMARRNAGFVPRVLLLQRAHAGSQSVTRAKAQRRNLQRSHDKLVSAVCPDAPPQLGRVLRLDEDLGWRDLTKAAWLDVCRQLEAFLQGAAARFNLQGAELDSFRHTITSRLGPAVGLQRVGWLPAALFPAVVVAASPRLYPPFNRVLAGLHTAWQRLKV